MLSIYALENKSIKNKTVKLLFVKFIGFFPFYWMLKSLIKAISHTKVRFQREPDSIGCCVFLPLSI